MKVSKTVENFFKYSFAGDGKYYTTEQGSRSYKNTDFQNFLNRNSDCIDVLEQGNDAPRGGRPGDFVIVKFNEKFYDKFGKYIEYLESKEKEAKEKEEERKRLIEEVGDQQKLLKDLFVENPEFHTKIKNRIENYSSKDWRGWVKLKVCQKITNERFDLLTLTPADIRDVAYSV